MKFIKLNHRSFTLQYVDSATALNICMSKKTIKELFKDCTKGECVLLDTGGATTHSFVKCKINGIIDPEDDGEYATFQFTDIQDFHKDYVFYFNWQFDCIKLNEKEEWCEILCDRWCGLLDCAEEELGEDFVLVMEDKIIIGTLDGFDKEDCSMYFENIKVFDKA